MQSEQQSNQPRNIHNNEQILNIDTLPTSQPELGPSIPDGGYGWLIYIANIFFQILIPSFAVNFGIFVAFTRLENATARNPEPRLWEEHIVKLPLFHIIFKTLLDPLTRSLSANVIWPRLVATSGTCLTCAGLLFVWMGMENDRSDWLFTCAGILTGIGATLLLSQSEILVGQYFRLKLPILSQISQIAMALGFILSPIILSMEILKSQLSHIILWYQAIIIQGLVVSLFYRLPPYMKSRQQNKTYKFLSLQVTSGDDEEDLFSKNSKELQLKRQNSETVKKIEIDVEQEPSTSTPPSKQNADATKNWVKFTDDDDKKEDDNFSSSSEDDDLDHKHTKIGASWEKFEDFNETKPKSLADEIIEHDQPLSLFTDSPINNNNTYSFADDVGDYQTPSVFAPNASSPKFMERLGQNLVLFKQATFYKTLLTSIALKYSWFVFFTLYPSFLYIETANTPMYKLGQVIGLMAAGPVCFYFLAYFMKSSKKTNAIFFSVYNILSFFGYIMISDTSHYSIMLWGGVTVCFSIFALDYYGKSFFGLSLKGECTEEYTLVSYLTAFSLFLFICFDASYRTCFRLMAVLQFFVGMLWCSNFVYNKLRVS